MGAVSDIKLFVSGDLMTGRGIDQIMPVHCEPTLYEPWVRDARYYVELAERSSGPVPAPVDYRYVWGDALLLLDSERPDFRIVNLETSVTTSDACWPGKGIHYRMHPGNAPCLAAASIDCCVLANNHVLDWGREGLLQTLSVLEAAAVAVAGAGHDLAAAAAPARLQGARGGRVLVFAAADISSGVPAAWAAAADRSGVHLLDDLSAATAARLAAGISAAREPRDRVMVSIHWGGNWGYEIPEEQREFAHCLVDSGCVDIVHGHSSHHARAVEIYRDRLILYGCGDLINDYEGIGGHAEYRPWLAPLYFITLDAATGELRRLDVVPLRLQRLRLTSPGPGDLEWFRAMLGRVSRPFGTAFAGETGRLVAGAGQGRLSR